MFYVAGVNALFTKTGCDRSAIDNMLNADEGVTDHNLMQYLGLVEERTNQLLLTRAFVIKRQVSAKSGVQLVPLYYRSGTGERYCMAPI